MIRKLIQVELWECSDEICDAILPCGHTCGRPWHLEDHTQLICLSICNRFCSRNVHQCKMKHYCGDPCPPCKQKFPYRLNCGHLLEIPCSGPDPDENSIKCVEPCQRKMLFCNHPCTKKCWEECGSCEKMSLKVPPSCPRNHEVLTNCQDDLHDFKCTFLIPSLQESACGHIVHVECHEADRLTPDGLASLCNEKCQTVFNGAGGCGHRCTGTCRKCFQGRFHVRCKEPCNADLICGHRCQFPCNLVCPPCSESSCVRFCSHQKCAKNCGVPCDWKCDEPCTYGCKHSQCHKKCSEVCDKALCNEPCPKILKCGHPCVGFCGEPCPADCRICNPSNLLRGMFFGNTEVSPTDRFIFLEECQHSIEVEGFEGWLRVRIESDEILPIQCPLCRKRISWIRRYSALMRQNLELVNAVREKVFGRQSEINEICQVVRRRLEAIEPSPILAECINNIFGEMETLLKRQNFSANLQQAKFLKWLSNELLEANDLIRTVATDLVDCPDLIKEYEILWINYFNYFVDRFWPLHPNEMKDLSLEKKRVECVTKLFSRYSSSQPENATKLIHNLQGEQMVDEIRSILFVWKPFTQDRQKAFQQKFDRFDHFLRSTLALPDEERSDIVKAFGETPGRWFKCSKGHIYVITECGGATEVSKCPECGDLIGGQNHSLVEGNYLASEMDGASSPLYPTALHRMPY